MSEPTHQCENNDNFKQNYTQSIRYVDSDPRPSELESPSLTTGPGICADSVWTNPVVHLLLLKSCFTWLIFASYSLCHGRNLFNPK